jgi:hypothetical protein
MMDDKPNTTMNTEDTHHHPEEPTVLDWVKSILRFKPIPIPEESKMIPQHLPSNVHNCKGQPNSHRLEFRDGLKSGFRLP